MGLARHPFFLLGVSYGPLLQEYRLPQEVHFPLTEESNIWDQRNATSPLIMFAGQWSVSSTAPASHPTLICTMQYQERAHALD